MRKLILGGVAAAALLAGGAAVTQPAHAAMQCWSGPLGILRTCHYAGPYGGPFYAPPPPPAYYGYGHYGYGHYGYGYYDPYWRY